MINTIFSIFNSELVYHYLELFFKTTFFYSLLLTLATSGVFGPKWTIFTIKRLYNTPNFFVFLPLFLFALVIIFANLLPLPVIFADTTNNVNLAVNTGEGTYVLGGNFWTELFDKVGSAGVFTAGLKFGTEITRMQNLSILRRYGIVLSGAGTTTVIWKFITDKSIGITDMHLALSVTNKAGVTTTEFKTLNEVIAQATLNGTPIDPTIVTASSTPITSLPVLTGGTHVPSLWVKPDILGLPVVKPEVPTSVTEAIISSIPKGVFMEPKSDFFHSVDPLVKMADKGLAVPSADVTEFIANSPLEGFDLPLVFSVISDVRFLLGIALYLLFNLALILAFRLYFTESIDVQWITKYIPNLGIGLDSFICKWLNRYFKVLQTTSNFWILFIMFFLVINILGSFYILSILITSLTHFIP